MRHNKVSIQEEPMIISSDKGGAKQLEEQIRAEKSVRCRKVHAFEYIRLFCDSYCADFCVGFID